MFGYITVDKPELKIKDFEAYKSYYCGLCRQLKKSSGNISRLSLSYDMTFIYLLLTSLYEPETKKEIKRCFVKGMGKVSVTENEIAEYIADMSVVMTYYKLRDDWKDDRSIKGGFFQLLLSRDNKNMAEKYPEKIKFFEEQMKKLAEGEKNKNYNLDEMSGCFGKIMGEIFAYKADIWQKYLWKMGFYLGKYIYLMDAYEDFEEDIKSGNYNPFCGIRDRYYDDEAFERYVEDILIMLMAKCAEEYEVLPIEENADLIENIIYSGVWTRFRKIRKQNQSDK